MHPSTVTAVSRRLDEEDELLAVRYRLPLLISARCTSTVTAVARRVHVAALGAAAPFVAFPASELIGEKQQFAEQWTMLMDAGRGGSVFITDVEEMSVPVQSLFAELLAWRCVTRSALAPRLVTGTTVSLVDRVKAGQFSEELLYRLNVIHLHRAEGCAPCPQCARLADERRCRADGLRPPTAGPCE
jgi:transcriptional regulator of aromatic amino acid metabolism